MADTVNIVVPTIGESVTEGTIGKWFVSEGDVVKKDQPLFEVDSDKATLEVPASASGKLKILVPAGKTASVGSVVGVIEASGAETGASNGHSASKATIVTAPKPVPETKAEVTAVEPAYESLQGLPPSKRKFVRQGTYAPPSA